MKKVLILLFVSMLLFSCSKKDKITNKDIILRFDKENGKIFIYNNSKYPYIKISPGDLNVKDTNITVVPIRIDETIISKSDSAIYELNIFEATKHFLEKKYIEGLKRYEMKERDSVIVLTPSLVKSIEFYVAGYKDMYTQDENNELNIVKFKLN